MPKPEITYACSEYRFKKWYQLKKTTGQVNKPNPKELMICISVLKELTIEMKVALVIILKILIEFDSCR